MLTAVLSKSFGITLTPVTAAEIVTYHNPAHIQLTDNISNKVLPGLFHGALVKAEEHHIINAEITADNVLSGSAVTDKGHVHTMNQLIRVNIKAEHRGLAAYLYCPLLGFFQQRTVTDVHTIENANGKGSLFLVHN